MNKLKHYLTLSVMFVSLAGALHAQGLGYEQKTLISEGLYKVKSGPYYGIVDRNGRVVVSVEYQDIQFNEGKALLTKNDYLWGIVDALGNIRHFDGEYRVKYRKIHHGFITVSPKKVKHKWGYITDTGVPFIVAGSIKGLISFGKKQPTLFDNALPFVDRIANVYIQKQGWKQFDDCGMERFVLANKKTKAILRTAVHKESCVIVADGIKQYQESPGTQAAVKLVLSPSATYMGSESEGEFTKISFMEGDLYVDSLFRATKFVKGKDSVVFIESPRKMVRKVVQVPVERRSLADDLAVSVKPKMLNANAKGRAYTEVKVANKSNLSYADLTVELECAGTSREWKGNLDGNSEVSISLNLPARFASEAIKRIVKVYIIYKEDSIDMEIPITIKRYTPVRSR